MSEKHGSHSSESAPSGEIIRKIGAFVTSGMAKIVDIFFPRGKG
jgi:hypothetical protein